MVTVASACARKPDAARRGRLVVRPRKIDRARRLGFLVVLDQAERGAEACALGSPAAQPRNGFKIEIVQRADEGLGVVVGRVVVHEVPEQVVSRLDPTGVQAGLRAADKTILAVSLKGSFDHHDVDPAALDVGKKPLQRGPLECAAGKPTIIVAVG